jgi:glycosyltransferase involved in cell wall biosynthesis
MTAQTEFPALSLAAAGQPFVSVVVPVYNGGDAIGRCIEALLAQDYPAERREIIIVDNNSTDGTPDIVRQYPVHLVFERAIQTSYAARNRGISHARGEIVAFTDADCVPRPEWLSQLVASFVDAHVAGAAGKVVPKEAVGLVAEFLSEINPVRSRERDGLWYVITANAAYRRQVLVAANGFRSDLFTGGDIDLALRLQLGGHGKLDYVEDAIIEHRYGDSYRELWKRFWRYGYSEIQTRTLLQNHAGHEAGAPGLMTPIGRQAKALVIYVLSFLWRLRRVPVQGWAAEYNLEPVLWGVAETASLWGKLRAILDRSRFRVRAEPKGAHGLAA